MTTIFCQVNNPAYFDLRRARRPSRIPVQRQRRRVAAQARSLRSADSRPRAAAHAPGAESTEEEVTKFREHRGSLADSLETTVEVDGRKGLLEYLAKRFNYPHLYRLEDVTVEPYGGIDKRCGWDTYIVHAKGWGVFGMTDGPCE